MTDTLDWSDKDPAEAINYGVDFSTILKTTDTIATASVNVALKNAVGLLSDLVLQGAVNISGQTVAQRFSAGTTAAEYIVKFTILTGAGETFIETKCLKITLSTC